MDSQPARPERPSPKRSGGGEDGFNSSPPAPEGRKAPSAGGERCCVERGARGGGSAGRRRALPLERVARRRRCRGPGRSREQRRPAPLARGASGAPRKPAGWVPLACAPPPSPQPGSPSLVAQAGGSGRAVKEPQPQDHEGDERQLGAAGDRPLKKPPTRDGKRSSQLPSVLRLALPGVRVSPPGRSPSSTRRLVSFQRRRFHHQAAAQDGGGGGGVAGAGMGSGSGDGSNPAHLGWSTVCLF